MTRLHIFLQQTALRGEVRLPTLINSTGVYYVIIKYKSPVNARSVRVTLSRVDASASLQGTVDILSTCISSSCYATVSRNFALSEATIWNVFVAFTGIISNSDVSRVQIENVILLPMEFFNATILGPRRTIFMSECDIVRNNLTRNGVLNQNCVQGVFSLTMGLLGNPFCKFPTSSLLILISTVVLP